MKTPSLNRYAFSFYITATLLAGCGGEQGMFGQAVSTPRLAPPSASRVVESVLYRFKGGRDGAGPGALIDVNGTLYGTSGGGCRRDDACGGTIFSMDTSARAHHVLHRYPKSRSNDGSGPAGLTYANGELYGATGSGGDLHASCGFGGGEGCGTVFKMDLSGASYTVLYRFKGLPDGAGPSGAPLYVDGVLYGTTSSGGSATGCAGDSLTPPCGTLYGVNATSGKENFLYSFQLGRDGYFPLHRLINGNGTLFGTTLSGGKEACAGSSALFGCGTIFKIRPSGKRYHVVYRFKGPYSNARPNNVIEVNGALYGTTEGSQSAGCADYPCVALFKFDIESRRLTILHRFASGEHNYDPDNELTYGNGVLYGTAREGGILTCYYGHGCGTVFAFDLASRKEKTLYRFKGGEDGATPVSVIYVNGVLYGTTAAGGINNHGTIFSLIP